MKEKFILLVEDNPDAAKFTILALRKANIQNEVVTMRDGQEALDYLLGGKAEDLPSVVFLDLKMPKIDGLEVLERLRKSERAKLLPVVILTTSQEEQDIVKSYNLGANSYVRKPIDFMEFVDAVRQLGLYWLNLNKTPALV